SVASFLPLHLFVIPPEPTCRLNVRFLALFCSAAEQDHDCFTVPAKVDAIPRTEIQTEFRYACSHALCRRKITILQPSESNCDTGARCFVQILEPSLERIAAQPVNILPDFDHDGMVTQKIL